MGGQRPVADPAVGEHLGSCPTLASADGLRIEAGTSATQARRTRPNPFGCLASAAMATIDLSYVSRLCVPLAAGGGLVDLDAA